MANFFTSIFIFQTPLKEFNWGYLLSFCAYCLIPLFLLLVWSILLRAEHFQNEKKKATWKKLAATHSFNFIADDPRRQGARLEGNYGNYHLRLFTQKVNGEGVLTFIELTIPNSITNPSVFKQSRGDELIIIEGKKVNLEEAVTWLIKTVSKEVFRGEIKLQGYYKGVSHQQKGIENDISFLQFMFERLSKILDCYRTVVEIGGEAVPPLKVMAARNNQDSSVISNLLEDIAVQTSSQLSDQASQLLCRQCLVFFGAHSLNLSWLESTKYYGCRGCGQSREFFYGPEGVVAVLDNTWSEAHGEQEGWVRINWLTRRTLFDFDAVEIVKTNDEEVERFAVQVGNDTDEFRKPRYQEMICIVRPECPLSENTMRILENMFGQVKQTMGAIHA